MYGIQVYKQAEMFYKSYDKFKTMRLSEDSKLFLIREDLKKNRKFSELGLICLSTYLPPLNCDDVNSDNWPEIS